MLLTHVKAERRYDGLRQMALKETEEALRRINVSHVSLRTIDGEALRASRLWAESETRRVNWDWADGYGSFRFRYPKRFEMAVWERSKLTGLSMGRPTYFGTAMRLDVVEAAPRDQGERMSVFQVALLGYEIYARLIGAKQIRIMHPINDSVKKYYESFGYQYVKRDDYLFQEII